jgi:glycosyltransferase involved in cell wall biosynthesis
VRIALLSDYPVDPHRIYGGVQAVAYHLAEGLAQHEDLDLHVIHSSRAVSASSISHDGRLTVHRIAPPEHPAIPNLIAALHRCARVLEVIKPDLANAHTGQYALAALRAGVTTVYTIHGIPHLVLPYLRSPSRLCAGMVHVLFDRLAIRRVHDIVAISPYIEKVYGNRTKARFHCAENPVPDMWFRTITKEVRGRILFVGSVARGKGLHFLLQVLGKLVSTVPEAHLHVAGRIDDVRYMRYLRRLQAEHRLNDRVRFLGPLDGSGVQEEYSQCTLLVLPSLVETAPLALMEAMASARPVVATRVGGVPDLIEDEVSGLLVEPGDTDGLSDCVGRLLRDPLIRTRMGNRGREVARTRFLRDTVVARYRQIYEDVIEGSR